MVSGGRFTGGLPKAESDAFGRTPRSYLDRILERTSRRRGIALNLSCFASERSAFSQAEGLAGVVGSPTGLAVALIGLLQCSGEYDGLVNGGHLRCAPPRLCQPAAGSVHHRLVPPLPASECMGTG
jgi:hypothetical protein